jgi:crotonobetainyl-CoA:carnitine CoA-transferase CaiB-like acyl-CoA transferase
MILADLGADVIWVEEYGPLSGRRAEQAKGTAIALEAKVTGFLTPHDAANSLNRNKRSIALNLKNDGAREMFWKLAKSTDVVVEEFRPGVTKRLGIDYHTLSRINPRLIYCAITGYGQEGSYCDLAGHDINYIAMAGALSFIGFKGGPPVIPSNLLADFAGGGMMGTISILAALIAREKTGRGQMIDTAMFDGVLSLINATLSWSLATGSAPKPGELPTTGAYPFYNVYETKDNKYITVGCIVPWFWANLCRAMGREEFIPHQWDTGPKREEIFGYFRQAFRTKTRDEWFERFAHTDICVGKVNTLDELATDLHVQQRKMITELADPRLGTVKQVGIPFKLSDTPLEIRRPTPMVGQHTQEVLEELGYSRTKIKEVREAGCIN